MKQTTLMHRSLRVGAPMALFSWDHKDPLESHLPAIPIHRIAVTLQGDLTAKPESVLIYSLGLLTFGPPAWRTPWDVHSVGTRSQAPTAPFCRRVAVGLHCPLMRAHNLYYVRRYYYGLNFEVLHQIQTLMLV